MGSKNPHEIPNLPGEIIIEILSRLPVKSLLRFLCISKSWRSLISSKHFIKTHLETSTKDTTFAHHRIISTIVKSSEYGLHNCSLRSLFCEPITHGFRIDFLMDKSDYSLNVVGSCNGLICLLIHRRYFCLWNPSTRESKKLPDIHDRIKDLYITEHGFGFDENSGDYKVYGALSGGGGLTAKVYSLKTDSWKSVEDFEDGSAFSQVGKFVCGNIHWSKKKPDMENSRWYICSFNLKAELYGIVEQPSNVEGNLHPSLGVIGGCLSVLYSYMDNGLDLWVWKVYGVKESWIKVLNIPCLVGPFDMIPFYAISKKREVLFKYESILVVYNPEDDCFRYLQLIGFDEFLEVEIYVESLVSLVVDGEQEWQLQLESMV